jgi:hypothetical protein
VVNCFQFDWDANGEMSPVAHDDLELVEERRRKISLPPPAEAMEKVRAATACSMNGPRLITASGFRR